MTPACTRAMTLAQKVASGLDSAERIWLETHLAGCPGCASQTAMLERLAGVLRDADWSLRPRAREAVLERALRAPSHRPDVEKRAGRRFVLPSIAAAVGMAAAAAALVLATPGEPPQPLAIGSVFRSSVAHIPRTPPKPDDQNRASGCEPASAAEVAAGTRASLGPGHVEVLRSARFCWRAEAATLELAAGAVRVEVAPGTAAGFRVATPRFVVQVIGTVFEVDPERVSVIRGKVRVLAPAAGDQLALLEAGQSFSPRPAKAAAAPPVVAAARLAQARRLVAAGRTAAARAELQKLARGALEALERAELQSLLAECSLVEGKLDDAARVYGEVASGHAGTLTGETALFAQARAELRAGRRAQARSRLQSYLARYPSGRFRNEALAHLRSLEASRKEQK